MGEPDYVSYEEYYESVISRVIAYYADTNAGVVVYPNSKQRIWENYVGFEEHCRRTYMRDQNKLIDRHKLAACYMYAILRAEPMVCTVSIQLGDDSSSLLNERLALCFGMTLLRALLCAEVDHLEAEENVIEKVRTVFENDISFPETNHGDYKDNLLTQLYYTRKESSYNILALAETLYLLECYNLVKCQIPENIFKK